MRADELQARSQLAEVGRLIYERGYVVGVEGNLSIRLSDDSLLTTPSGTCKGRLQGEDMVVTDMNGKPRDGEKRKPSTELPIHLAAYKHRPDVQAVVHAHPSTAVGFTVAGVSLAKCILPEVICTLGLVATAPYATPSTDELPESLTPYLADHDAIMLDHHGALLLGTDIWDAFYKLELLESYARTMLTAHMLGGPQALAPDDVKKLIAIRGIYGLTRRLPEEKLLSSQSFV